MNITYSIIIIIGALDDIVETMKTHHNSIDVILEAIDAMKAICMYPWQSDRKLRVLGNGGAQMVKSSMEKFFSDADIQLTGCAFITTIGTTVSDDVTNKIIELGLPQQVIEYI